MTTEIKLCSYCKGEGVRHESELVDYHKRDYRHWSVVCDTCAGSGRVKVTTITTTEIVPYVTPDVYDVDDR